MKNFFLRNGKSIIEVCAWLVLLIIVVGIASSVSPHHSFGFYLSVLEVLFISLITYFLVFYLFFTLGDICSSLREIREILDKLEKNNNLEKKGEER